MYFQAVLVMFGFIISFGIRCNVGVATVSMMSNKTADNGSVVELRNTENKIANGIHFHFPHPN